MSFLADDGLSLATELFKRCAILKLYILECVSIGSLPLQEKRPSMSETIVDLSKPTLLRLDAEARLQQGVAPPTQGWTLSSNTLSTLYKLASVPDTAAESLRLLHELQTYQVELDLQHEQLLANEREFAQELAHYKALYDFAPFGYLIIDHDGRIVESNQAGANLLQGSVREELVGRLVDHFLTTESRLTLNTLLKKLNQERESSSCFVFTNAIDPRNGARRLRISANVSPGSDVFLLAVSKYD